jgi:hypothetical protein
MLTPEPRRARAAALRARLGTALVVVRNFDAAVTGGKLADFRTTCLK